MLTKPLPAEKLRRRCTQTHFSFASTADLEKMSTIIGQPRGTQAIEFGIDIPNQGYNIYVLGETGTGRTTAISRFLKTKSAAKAAPDDWVYVHNFEIQHQPRAFCFPPGQGEIFQQAMEALLKNLVDDLPKSFSSDAFVQTIDNLERQFEGQREQLFSELQKKANAQSLQIIKQPTGLTIVPLADGTPMKLEQLQQLSSDEQELIQQNTLQIKELLDDVLYQAFKLEGQAKTAISELEEQVASSSVLHHFEALFKQYENDEKLVHYLKNMYQDVVDNFPDFLPVDDGKAPPPDLRRYSVNLLVNNKDTEGAPVIVEPNPTLFNLIGRIEHEMVYGAMSTHFSNIKSGSLHRANGGFLVVNGRDLLTHPASWEALKRAIKGEDIRVQTHFGESQLMTKTLDPEPIPLNIKIIILGSAGLYYALYEQEEDFSELFKVKADFDSFMPRDHEHEDEYAHFIANLCDEEELRHFTPDGVANVIEYGARLASHQNKLSARFGIIADLIREASYWAAKQNIEWVNSEAVQHALSEREYRANRIEEDYFEQIEHEIMLIATEGKIAGQLNGLSVMDMGDHSFGIPTRITTRTFMGAHGVVNIEREVQLAGPIHNKGLLTISGYMGGTYAQKNPLSLSASIAFEQQYGPIDGDSASSTELYTLLSSLSDVPINQGIAVTGSVNQRGEIQPVGGVNQKIEGFFRICNHRGLTGQQGVMIPAANVNNLMLKEELVAAVDAGQFHIWAVSTIDQGIEILTGIRAGIRQKNGRFPRGTIHYKVQTRLRKLAEELQAFENK